VKAEVNRSIELDELKKMKSTFEDAARDVEQTVGNEIRETSAELDKSWSEVVSSTSATSAAEALATPVPEYRRPNKNWRVKRSAMPQWYKQRHGVRGKAQSGAARVARFRPPRPQA